MGEIKEHEGKIYFMLNDYMLDNVCRDVTNSWLDDKLPLAGFWLFIIEVILSKERIQNYSFFLISKNMKPRKM